MNQKLYGVDEAIKLKELKSAKFDESLEVSLNLGVDPRHADQMVRGMVVAAFGHRQGRQGRRVRPW